MRFGLILAALAWLVFGAPARAAGPSADLALWRLDCGTVQIPDADFLNDTFAFSGVAKTVTVSCYLIKDGETYMLWDAGLPLSRLGQGGVSVGGGPARLSRSIVDQLAELKLAPSAISLVALSHYHADHAGQAASFPNARLLIGAQDFDVVRSSTPAFNLDREQFTPWTHEGGQVDLVAGDRDVFGDGAVIMLAAPGHTPGHHALLVRLASGPVILTGDLWHFAEQVPIDGVPKINTSRADSLASMDRIKKLAANLHAKVVIGHEPADIAKLAAFPDAQR